MDGFRVYVDQVEEKIYVYIPMFECFLLFFIKLSWWVKWQFNMLLNLKEKKTNMQWIAVIFSHFL